MTANLALILAAAAIIGCGVYLILERSLTRVLVGLVHARQRRQRPVPGLRRSLPGGRRSSATSDTAPMSDPLPQALVLTAIVISLGTTAFLLAMAYRSWQLTGHDDVQDDVEDRGDPPARRGRRGLRQLRPVQRGTTRTTSRCPRKRGGAHERGSSRSR